MIGKNHEMTVVEKGTDAQPSRPTWVFIVTIIALWVIFGGGLFALANEMNWPLGWLYFGLFAAGNGVHKASLLIWNPGLLGRRHRIGSGTKAWDKVWLPSLLLILGALFYITLRDFSMPLTDLGPPELSQIIGLTIYVMGLGLFAWASLVNPFFEVSVRIQEEEGHRVVDSGPYAIVRHPGYVGYCAAFLATPLMLPSFWVSLLSLIVALILGIRTTLEDRTLQAELQGYATYASRVRFRLIPGIW